MPSFFFPPKVGDVPEYSQKIIDALGPGFEGSLVRAAVSEALLNAIIYGALGVTQPEGVRDPVEFHEAISAAEKRVEPRVGIDVYIPTEHADAAERIVCIQDPGPGFNWRSGLLRLADAEAKAEYLDLATSGRGLALILAGTRAVEWNEAGSEIRLRFRSSQAMQPSTASPVPAGIVIGRDGTDPLAITLPPMASPRILVVDDVDINCRLITKMMEWEGYTVRSAGDGQSAIEEVEAWRPEIVVMDVNMPRMNGLEAVRHMRDRGLLNATSVMLLTAGTFDGEFKSEAIEAGACDFLEKPISRRELIARVRRRLKTFEKLNQAEKGQAALEASMTEAKSVMVSLMPPSYLDARPGRIETLVAPSNAVGGDVVDFVRVSEYSWATFLLDVAGHGLAAALTASASRAILLDQLTGKASLASALTALNNRLLQDFDRTGHQAAVAAVFVDAQLGIVEIVNAGCPPVAVWTHDGQTRLVRSGSPPAGLIDDAQFASAQFTLGAVARIVLVSDGIVEAFASPADTLGALGIACANRELIGLSGLPSSQIYTSLTSLGPDRDDASVVWIEFSPQGSSTERSKP